MGRGREETERGGGNGRREGGKGRKVGGGRRGKGGDYLQFLGGDHRPCLPFSTKDTPRYHIAAYGVNL